MSQMVDQWPEPDQKRELPAWIIGPADAGDQGRPSPSLTRARPRLMQTLRAALPVIGRGVQLALPAVLAVLASQAFDERRRRSDVAVNCRQEDEPQPGGNLTVEVWMAQVTVSPDLCISLSDTGDWATFSTPYRG